MFQLMEKIFTELDLIGHPVTLKMNGRKTYKTLPGALLTLVIVIIVFTSLTTKIIAYKNKTS